MRLVCLAPPESAPLATDPDGPTVRRPRAPRPAPEAAAPPVVNAPVREPRWERTAARW